MQCRNTTLRVLGVLAVLAIVLACAPAARAYGRVVGKSCGACGRAVSITASVGERCPHCSAFWGYQRETTVSGSSSAGPTRQPRSAPPPRLPQPKVYRPLPPVVIPPTPLPSPTPAQKPRPLPVVRAPEPPAPGDAVSIAVRLAEAYRAAGQLDRAIEVVEAALAKGPRSPAKSQAEQFVRDVREQRDGQREREAAAAGEAASR